VVSNAVTFTVIPTPSISSLSPTSGSPSTILTITGANFGNTQGTSTLTLNGVTVTPTTWSSTSITAQVPVGSTTGNVAVTVGGIGSNGIPFTVTTIAVSINPSSATFTTGTGGGFAATVQNDVQNNASKLGVTWTVSGAGCSGNACGVVGPALSPYNSSYTAPPTVPTPPTVTLTATSNADPTKSGTATITITQANPVISALSPSSGGVNSAVTITGTGFGASQGSSSVTFNGMGASVAAFVASWSDTSLSTFVPGGATTGNVVVTVGVTPSNGVSFTVTPSNPNITGLSPTFGAVGTTVTISGTGFGDIQGNSVVTFNGKAAVPTAWSATSITASVPAGASAGSVVVTVGGVASNGVNFSVTPNLSSINPTNGAAGTPVTLSGTSFGATQGTSTVTFNGTTGTPTAWSATSITVPVPAGATTGSVVVTVGGQASNGVSFTVTVPPSITSLNPTSGSVGTPITITGANFGATQGTSSITFNGTPATPTSWNATTIVAPVPAGATTGNVFVTVGGQASNGSNFTVTNSTLGIVLVQQSGKDAGVTTSSSLAFPSNNTAGNWIAVCVRAGRSGQVVTVTDSRGNTYNTAIQFNVTVDTPNGDTL